jgi:hypothetical protein
MTGNQYEEAVAVQIYPFSTLTLHADEWPGSNSSHFTAGNKLSLPTGYETA